MLQYVSIMRMRYRGAVFRASMGDVPRILFLGRIEVAGTLSAFFDECGQENKFQPDTKYYLLTVVLHDQSNPIDALIAGYEANLRGYRQECVSVLVDECQVRRIKYPF